MSGAKEAGVAVLSAVGPVYLGVLIGYLAVRGGLVPASALPALGSFVITIALPGLLFGALATRRLSDLVHPGYVAGYAAGSIVALSLGYALALRLKASDDTGGDGDVRRRTRAAYLALASGTSNSGFIGLPILLAVIPQQAPAVFGMNVLVENVLVIPLGLALAERAAGAHVGRRDLARRTALMLVRTPMVLAIVAGTAASVLQLPLPDVMGRTVTMLGQATTAPALFIIGGNLVGRSIAGRWRVVAPMVVGKLCVHPLAVAACVAAVSALAAAAAVPWWPPLDPVFASAAVLSASMPTIAIIAVLAARHGQEDDLSAAAFATTLVGAVTLSATIAVLRALPGSGV